MLISFTGCHCSGKTTLLNKCKEEYGDEFEYVDEITRKALKLGLEINENGDDETQMFIIESHKNNAGLDNAILDRCIIDGYVYTESLFFQQKIHQSILTKCKHVYEDIVGNLDIIFATAPVSNLEDDGVRSTSEQWRGEITNSFMIKLQELQNRAELLGFAGKVVHLHGDVEERFNIVKSVIAYEKNKEKN
jgi:nicotinamide riboside kinase